VAAAAAATATATAAAASVLRLVDSQVSAAEILAVECADSSIGCLVVHLDESKASGPAGLTIRKQTNLMNGAMRCEKIAHLIFSRTEGQVSDVDFLNQFQTP